MEFLFLFTLWELCLVGAFVGGYVLGNIKKAKKTTAKPLSAEEQREVERRRKEDENFRTYDGTPQERIY
jgi:hypothetical protein